MGRAEDLENKRARSQGENEHPASPVSDGSQEISLSDEETKILQEEERALVLAQRSIRRTLQRHEDRSEVDDELMQLRDQLAESHEEDHAMLVEHMTRLSALRAQQDAGSALRTQQVADPDSPYFAHLELWEEGPEGGRRREVFIGRRAHLEPGEEIQIVDWRSSPISRLYYCYQEGEDFVERFGEREREGILEKRRGVTIRGGTLQRIEGGEAILERDASGWRARPKGEAPQLSGGAGIALRPTPRFARQQGGQLPEITALIDPAQFELLTAPRSGTIIIQGGAGTGKTTIALHRAAWLHFQDPAQFSAKKMLVITPGHALKRYIAQLLPSLEVDGVPTLSFPEWVEEATRRRFPELRKHRFRDEGSLGPRRIKRHPATLARLDEILREEEDQISARFETTSSALHEAWMRRSQLPIYERLGKISRWLNGEGSGANNFATRRAIEEARRDLATPIDIWTELLSGSAALRDRFEAEGVAELAPHWALEELADQIALQREAPPTQDELISGPSASLRGSLDGDDCALLLRIAQRREGRRGPRGQPLPQATHVVVDEAQDLSPVALQLLCALVPPKGPVTLAGDTAQRVVFDNGFARWDEIIPKLPHARLLPPLSVSYRSTAQVMNLAREVLGSLVHDWSARDARQGPPVTLRLFNEEGERLASLAEALRALVASEGRASVGLIARDEASARRHYEALQRVDVPSLRLVIAQDFSFRPGIDLTTPAQVKGLEYDYIVILDANERSYPATDESRHLLHVAATRAAWQLWLHNCDGRSPLLGTWCDTAEHDEGEQLWYR